MRAANIKMEEMTIPPGEASHIKLVFKNNSDFDLEILSGDRIALVVAFPMDPPMVTLHAPQNENIQ
jgi:hypothetical protein